MKKILNMEDNIMKKLLTAILVLSMALSVCACQGDGYTGDNTEVVTDTTASVAEEDIYANLPTGDYTGEEFNFANETLCGGWAILMLDCENTGEVLDSAVYRRNRLVEENLGITIKVEEYGNGNTLANDIVRFVMSGDDPYDVYDICSNNVAALILEDYFVDTEALGINLDNPWWNDTVMDSLSFNGTCYSIAGDLSVMLWEASYGLMYNKDMAEKLGLPDQYQLVRDGEFTIDSVNTAMALAYEDNGNAVVDTEDTFGLAGNRRLMTYSMIAGGEMLIPIGEDGLPYFKSPSERFFEMYEKIFDVYFNNDAVFLANKLKFKDSSKTWGSIFWGGDALYYFEPIGSSKNLRDSKFDYGFLPLPKYDASQESYITPLLQYVHTMYVTKANADVEMIGVVLENLAAESHRIVRPAYFEKVLEGKRTKDDGSIEMLEIIFENQVMNPATVFDWGGLASAINDSAFGGNKAISSRIASITSMIQSDIQETVDYYSK